MGSVPTGHISMTVHSAEAKEGWPLMFSQATTGPSEPWPLHLLWMLLSTPWGF